VPNYVKKNISFITTAHPARFETTGDPISTKTQKHNNPLFFHQNTEQRTEQNTIIIMSNSEEFNDEEMGVVVTDDDDNDEKSDNEKMSEEEKEARALIPYLSQRAYHIPGHTYLQDWYQNVIANNHPLFGLFLSYKYHPVTMLERIMVLLASAAGSLAISEGFYLLWLQKEGGYVSMNGDTDLASSYQGYKIFVYTAGAVLHTAFDMFIWDLAGCSCAEPGGKLDRLNKKTKTSPLLVFCIFFSTSTLAIMLTLLLETIDNGKMDMDKDEAANYTLSILEGSFSAIDWNVAVSGVGSDAENYKWWCWFKHLLLFFFVYDIAFATLFFSGILNCCCSNIPLIGHLVGGRPLEMAHEKEAEMTKEEENSTTKKKKIKKKKKKKPKRQSELQIS
jgi:hypothetical protein